LELVKLKKLSANPHSPGKWLCMEVEREEFEESGIEIQRVLYFVTDYTLHGVCVYVLLYVLYALLFHAYSYK